MYRIFVKNDLVVDLIIRLSCCLVELISSVEQ